MRSFVNTPRPDGIGRAFACPGHFIFSLTSTLLLKPLPYPHPDKIAILWLRSPGIGIPQDWRSPGQFHDRVTQNHVFEDTALSSGESFTLTDRLKAIKVDGIRLFAL